MLLPCSPALIARAAAGFYDAFSWRGPQGK